NGNESNFFPRKYADLHWSCPVDDFDEQKTWNDAKTHCVANGGRLPTFSDMRTLFRNCPQVETDGECALTDICTTYDPCYTDGCNGCATDDMKGIYSVFCDGKKENRTYWTSHSNLFMMGFRGAFIVPSSDDGTQTHFVLCVQEK
ncbi:hypothetical protein KAH37_10495, partial [bacterium]|nr:hypothetical protein [bacterium]